MKKEKFNSLLAENEKLIDVYKPNFLRTFMINLFFLLLWIVLTIVMIILINQPSDEGLGYALYLIVWLSMYVYFSAGYLALWLIAFCVTLIWYLRNTYIFTDQRVILKKGGKILSLNIREISNVVVTNIFDKLFGLKTGGIYFYTDENGVRKTKFVFKYVRKAKLIGEKINELKNQNNN